jgi:hypothetical protein
VLAHRTSPTNIGLSLLATLAAHDFGYLSLARLIERTEATFATLARLDRYRGHFYNWYDTRTLAPLHPRYVSSVDSGNLAGCLLALRQGLLALARHAPARARGLEGLLDTAAVLRRLAPAPLQAPLTRFLQMAETAAEERRSGTTDAAKVMTQLREQARTLAQAASDDPVLKEWTLALERQCADAGEELAAFGASPAASLEALAGAGSAKGRDWLERLQQLAARAEEFTVLDYEFLYDRSRDLFSIGFNVDDYRRDPGYYDLLASEARLGIFVAIAQGQVPQRAWFSLGRLITRAGGTPVLLSWSGSMFEYLMPHLLMPAYPRSLLEHTGRAAVTRQVAYGRERDVPWGVSECGYHLTDAAQNYQYRAFGVPGLGLQRGLSQELVIAPYASALALLAAPNDAAANLQRLAEQGVLGACGFYEALDYTDARIPPGNPTPWCARSWRITRA